MAGMSRVEEGRGGMSRVEEVIVRKSREYSRNLQPMCPISFAYFAHFYG